MVIQLACNHHHNKINSVNIWKVNKNPLLYSFKSDEYFNVIEDLGYNSISIYKEVSNKFLEEAKKRNIKVLSLLPEVLAPSYDYLKLTDINGKNFGQICFSEHERWSENNIKRLDFDLVDEYIISDIPWYLSLLSEHMPRKRRLLPFFLPETKKVLKENNINIPNVINFDKKWEWWKSEIENKLFSLYMERFNSILDFMVDKQKWFPVTVRKDYCENLSSTPIVNNLKPYINNYNINIILMNAVKQINLIKKFKTENNLVVGGTENALGLIDDKNGRKLFEKDYNGFVTNEHQLFNNRHPTWKQIKAEMEYLKEIYV